MDIATLTQEILKFRNERDWAQFHKPKDVAISLLLEAGEVLEHFQWKTDEEIKKYVTEHTEELGDEIADVLNYLLILANDTGIDIPVAFTRKLAKNAQKYPVAQSKGRRGKYTEYQNKP